MTWTQPQAGDRRSHKPTSEPDSAAAAVSVASPTPRRRSSGRGEPPTARSRFDLSLQTLSGAGYATGLFLTSLFVTLLTGKSNRLAFLSLHYDAHIHKKKTNPTPQNHIMGVNIKQNHFLVRATHLDPEPPKSSAQPHSSWSKFQRVALQLASSHVNFHARSKPVRPRKACSTPVQKQPSSLRLPRAPSGLSTPIRARSTPLRTHSSPAPRPLERAPAPPRRSQRPRLFESAREPLSSSRAQRLVEQGPARLLELVHELLGPVRPGPVRPVPLRHGADRTGQGQGRPGVDQQPPLVVVVEQFVVAAAVVVPGPAEAAEP